MLPIEKQGHFYEKLFAKQTNQSKRILDFDNFNQKTETEKFEIPK